MDTSPYDGAMVDGISLLQFVLIGLGVLIGGAIQGTVGFGLAMIAAPVVALVRPEALPATLLLLAVPLTVGMWLRERREVDLEGLSWIVGGRVLGTAAGVGLLIAVPKDSLEVLFGSVIVAAASMAALRPARELGRRNRFVAGAVSGVMGTTTSIGGPPLAILYRDRPGPEIRSTLAVSFVAGLVISIGGLLLARRIAGWQALLALELVVPLGIGLLVGSRLSHLADRAWLRPAVLAFSGVAGAAALARGLL